MARSSKTFLLTSILVILSLSGMLSGCRKKSISPEPDNKEVNAVLCENINQLTIGFFAGGHMTILDTCNSDINHSVAFSLNPQPLSVYEYDAKESPDRKWSIEQNGGLLSINAGGGLLAPVPITSSEILSRPRWSPDGKFVFYVTHEDKTYPRSMSECFDDAYDIHVFSVEIKKQSKVGRVCAGLPYTSLRWLYRPK